MLARWRAFKKGLWQDRCEAIHGRFGADFLSATIPPEAFLESPLSLSQPTEPSLHAATREAIIATPQR
jgi:hypothetical protein